MGRACKLAWVAATPSLVAASVWQPLPLIACDAVWNPQLVAIDAEFVAVSKEVTRSSARGKTIVVKPARLSLARVSCIRGDGPLAGAPFIDSYIQQVVERMQSA